ncbi:hypothetical protein ACQCU1_18800 [Sutcliffiella horikoshii]
MEEQNTSHWFTELLNKQLVSTEVLVLFKKHYHFTQNKEDNNEL